MKSLYFSPAPDPQPKSLSTVIAQHLIQSRQAAEPCRVATRGWVVFGLIDFVEIDEVYVLSAAKGNPIIVSFVLATTSSVFASSINNKSTASRRAYVLYRCHTPSSAPDHPLTRRSASPRAAHAGSVTNSELRDVVGKGRGTCWECCLLLGMFRPCSVQAVGIEERSLSRGSSQNAQEVWIGSDRFSRSRVLRVWRLALGSCMIFPRCLGR
jgi:hypothetical protein